MEITAERHAEHLSGQRCLAHGVDALVSPHLDDALTELRDRDRRDDYAKHCTHIWPRCSRSPAPEICYRSNCRYSTCNTQCRTPRLLLLSRHMCVYIIITARLDYTRMMQLLV